jgi:FtsP/CotA-like multicopper oxidase with cupredoxin domain
MTNLSRVASLCLVVVTAGLTCLSSVSCAGAATSSAAAGAAKIRTYYIAADEVDWNYAPSGRDEAMGMPFMGVAKAYMEHGPNRIGTVYRKAIYREYTDDSFKTLKPRPGESEYLGILGPMIRAEVGDTIKVVFRNNGTHPYSVHPHGVFYKKNSEGNAYNDGSATADKVNGAVPPGQTYTYTWEVRERAGPGPKDPSSVVWLYHSHANEMQDVNAGLVGVIVVTRKGMARPDGRPKDVNREFATLFMLFDENQSWFLDYNVEHHTDDPKGTHKDEFIPVDEQGRFNFANPVGFAGVNFRYTINGMQYGNLPMMTMTEGEHVRWYLVTIGFGFNFHTAHWHGNVILDGGRRTDVVAISPAQMVTVDMVPDDPGTWLLHCHVSDHMEGGMMAFYKVLPKR